MKGFAQTVLRIGIILAITLCLLLHATIFYKMRTSLLRSQQDILSLQQQLLTASTTINRPQKLQTVEQKHPIQDTSSNSLHYNPVTPYTSCEEQFGMSLVQNWATTAESWCTTPPSASLPSSLTCYPYHQKHKQQSHRTKDLFCIAQNFFIDFSKVSGTPVTGPEKPPRGTEYLTFTKGALTSPCKTTSYYDDSLFMNHHKLLMREFISESSVPGTYETIEHPIYMLPRDEDYENTFHTMADFMNIMLVDLILDPKLRDQQQILLFDRFNDGPYIDLLSKGFSKTHNVIRHTYFGTKTVLFKQLIFHLESPAALIFPEVAIPDPLTCYSTGLFHEFRRLVLSSFDLWDVSPPEIPTAVLSLRHRTDHKNVGRVLANENEVISVIQEGNMMRFQSIDSAKMSFSEQLKLIRNANILIGVHGAGLMHIMFAAEEAVLLEIHPSYRQDRHFRHAARMTGKIYLPMRSTNRETCQGTSDNILVPLEEFRKTLDGAVRLARSFDNGLAECGLTCNTKILAIDKGLIPYYTPSFTRDSPLELSFPC